ncbi:Uncharacterised protein [Serratia ficaria]|nr:Uncharacterised protein [Serratia ficaria]
MINKFIVVILAVACLLFYAGSLRLGMNGLCDDVLLHMDICTRN